MTASCPALTGCACLPISSIRFSMRRLSSAVPIAPGRRCPRTTCSPVCAAEPGRWARPLCPEVSFTACADRPAHHPSRVSGSDEQGHLFRFLLLLALARFRSQFHHRNEVASAFSSTDIVVPAPRFGVRSDVAAARRSSYEGVSPVCCRLSAGPLSYIRWSWQCEEPLAWSS